jgi:hypothetical protein
MSPKIPSLFAGVTALGLFWSATDVVAEPWQSPAPDASSAPSPTVLMLSSGQVFVGQISEDDDGYILKNKVGEIRYPRRRVEKTFPTLHDAYEYKKERTPERDPDERMKLAQWCIGQRLHAEAEEQLRAILELSPDYGPAKAMQYQLQAAAKRAATRDADVVQASTESTASDRATPASLNLDALREAARANPASTLPDIFRLPRAQALRRYQEFGRTIHPELQRRCITCHKDQSTAFQLIPAPTRRDKANDLILRANLEAVLKLVNHQEPLQSDLLKVLLLPHQPSNQPLLPGPNSPTYRQIAAWVYGMKGSEPTASPGGRMTVPPGLEADATSTENEGFAMDRLPSGPSVSPPAALPQLPKATSAPRTSNLAPTGTVGGRSGSQQSSAFDDPNENTPVVRGTQKPDGTAGTVAVPPANGRAGGVDPNSDMIYIPGMGNLPLDKRATSRTDPDAKDAAKRKKARKIPAAALEKVLQAKPAR